MPELNSRTSSQLDGAHCRIKTGLDPVRLNSSMESLDHTSTERRFISELPIPLESNAKKIRGKPETMNSKTDGNSSKLNVADRLRQSNIEANIASVPDKYPKNDESSRVENSRAGKGRKKEVKKNPEASKEQKHDHKIVSSDGKKTKMDARNKSVHNL